MSRLHEPREQLGLFCFVPARCVYYDDPFMSTDCVFLFVEATFRRDQNAPLLLRVRNDFRVGCLSIT